jgi:hypothetical protein
LEEALQVLVEGIIPVSRGQNTTLRQLCVGVLLAGSSQLTRIARWLKQDSQQASRVQWLRRSLQSGFLSQEYVYYPFVKHVLARHRSQTIHLVMDRTPLGDQQTDLLSLNMNFRHHAVPLVWLFMPHGMRDYETQKTLVERCRPLLPASTPVVFHGDTEFGSVKLRLYLRKLKWDFVVGQSSKTTYRQRHDDSWHALSTLGVTKRQAVYLEQIELTQRHASGWLNLFAFYQPRFSNRRRKRNSTYCATSLPITPALRRIGQRRWGIECYFKDCKSAGWHLQLSDLTHEKRREGLLTVLNLAYLWATCIGRCLCKVSNRQAVDSKAQRHLSLFRLGWDWLVHQYTMGKPCPTLSTLYP